MERIKCEIREAGVDDRGMLVLLAEETLHPLAEYAGHPERYHTGDVVGLLDRADVFVAQCGEETGGFVAVETEGDACAVRCICVNPGFEARGVANQLLDWVEGLAIERRLSRLVALVPAADAPSLRLYRGHGFVRRDADGRSAGAREAPAGAGTEVRMHVWLIAVPYDLGRADVGSGRGPAAYLKAGAAEALRARGHEVDVVTVKRERAVRGRAQRGPRRRPRPWRPPWRTRCSPTRCRSSWPATATRRSACRPACSAAAPSTPASSGWTRTATSTPRRPPRRATSTACRWPCSAAAPTASRASAARRGAARPRPRSCTPAGATSTARSAPRCSPPPCVVVDGAELRDQGPAEALAPALDALARERRDVLGPRARTRRRRRTCTSTSTCSTRRRRPASRSRPRTGSRRRSCSRAIDLVRERFQLIAVTVTSFTPARDEAGTTLAAGLAVLQRVTAEHALRS